ncbi:MAG: NAD(P)-dependent oxidoreductase [Limnohabitans sp.]|nr:NAD(P)-dependent oxidoreductase [Limnohabitans sp.]
MNIGNTDQRTIGFVGIGKMGLPMAHLLALSGRSVIAFDSNPDQVKRLRETSPSVAAAHSLKELAEKSQIIITILPDSRIVESVVVGSGDSLLAGIQPGTTLLEMSSGDPQVTKRLALQLAKQSVSVLDAPVSGGVARAITGELAIMVGGSETLLEQVRDILAVMGKAIHHVGPIGAGQAMKAINNMVSAGGFLIASEALQIGQRFGLEPQRMLDVLNTSSGRNNSTEVKFKPYVLSEKFDSGFSIELMVKDLGTAVSLANATETVAPFSAACLELWKKAHVELNQGADHTAIAKAVQNWSSSHDASKSK